MPRHQPGGWGVWCPSVRCGAADRQNWPTTGQEELATPQTTLTRVVLADGRDHPLHTTHPSETPMSGHTSCPDPYAVLGVPVDASQALIDRAYRTLVRRYHPDSRSVSDPERAASDDARLHRSWPPTASSATPSAATTMATVAPTPHTEWSRSG